MSTLIIGGLFALAILAIIGLFFLLRSEPRTPKVPVTKVSNEPLQVSETAQVASAGAPTLPAPKDEAPSTLQTLPVQQHVQRFPIVNGQFHKLSDELHALHTQAQEIEQRLGVLTEMLERIEHNQNQYVNVDEEVNHSNEPVPAN